MSDSFQNLKLFQEAHKFVLLIYRLSNKFPQSETYALTSQIRRAAASICANIVEGRARNHKKEFLQFLYIGHGSLEETKYHLLIARDLGYISNTEYEEIHDQAEYVGKLLNGLINYCKT